MFSFKRKVKRHSVCVFLLCLVILTFNESLLSWITGRSKSDYLTEGETRELHTLKRKVKQLTYFLRKHDIPEEEFNNDSLPTIFVITPTYARPQQKAELTRLKHVFTLVPSLHWIVIEDAEVKTTLVEDFLKTCGLPFTHLHQATPVQWKLKEKVYLNYLENIDYFLQNNEPNWYKPRGVLQRNKAIKWLHDAISVKTASGVVYFADDDNTYSTELFDEMRWTQGVSVWPVGLVGGVMVERPKVKNNEVIGWLTSWRPDRPFAIDMAGFAVHLSLLLQNKEVFFSHSSNRGFLESDFLTLLITLKDLEPKAQFCTKVYVWHTRTEAPNLRGEDQLKQFGKHTNYDIEV